MSTTILTVPDMSCAHCELTIQETLSPLAGVEQVNVDLSSHTVRVAFDPAQIDVAQMGEALAAESYPVTSAEVVASQ